MLANIFFEFKFHFYKLFCAYFGDILYIMLLANKLTRLM